MDLLNVWFAPTLGYQPDYSKAESTILWITIYRLVPDTHNRRRSANMKTPQLGPPEEHSCPIVSLIPAPYRWKEKIANGLGITSRISDPATRSHIYLDIIFSLAFVTRSGHPVLQNNTKKKISCARGKRCPYIRGFYKLRTPFFSGLLYFQHHTKKGGSSIVQKTFLWRNPPRDRKNPVDPPKNYFDDRDECSIRAS